MSLSQNVRNRIIDNITTLFDAIGVEKNTKMPTTRTGRPDNKGPIAWEYFVSTYLASRAKARADKAKKQAVQAGIIFDHEKYPKKPGTNEQIYQGDHVTVWLTVRNPSTKVDADEMSAYLEKKGVDTKLLADAYVHASKATRPAHEFKVSLVSSIPGGK